ncbi:MAG: class I SAM-dependent methyltransferase [Candidatus Helarchaeota archaeon]
MKHINQEKVWAYYEAEGKTIKAKDVDKYYRGIFRYVSTHGCRRAILDKWFKALKPGETFLDVGCELGYFVRKAAERGLQATGIDISPTKIKKAKQIAMNFKLNCNFYVMNAQKLEFEEGSFDWVLCSETLEHVPNDARAIKELIRVAKRFIVITVPQKSFFWRLLNKFSSIYGFDDLGAGHLREYTWESLKKLIPKGVAVIAVKRGGYFFAGLDKVLPDFSIFKAILCVWLKK